MCFHLPKRMPVLAFGTILAVVLCAGQALARMVDSQLRPERGDLCSHRGPAALGPCPGVTAVQASSNQSSGWKLVRTPDSERSRGMAIVKTADTARSDPDFAGLMVRCADKGKIEVLVVLVNPFPPRSNPVVTIVSAARAEVFEGKVAAAGAAVLLPEAAAGLAGGVWQTASSLAIAVKDNATEIKGLVGLNGLRPAYSDLLANCMQ
jgi:hypothetical protein